MLFNVCINLSDPWNRDSFSISFWSIVTFTRLLCCLCSFLLVLEHSSTKWRNVNFSTKLHIFPKKLREINTFLLSKYIVWKLRKFTLTNTFGYILKHCVSLESPMVWKPPLSPTTSPRPFPLLWGDDCLGKPRNHLLLVLHVILVAVRVGCLMAIFRGDCKGVFYRGKHS